MKAIKIVLSVLLVYFLAIFITINMDDVETEELDQ